MQGLNDYSCGSEVACAHFVRRVHHGVPAGVLLTMSASEILSEIGFNMDIRMPRTPADVSIQEDEYLATTMSDLARKMFWQEWSLMQLYRRRPP